MPTPLQVIESFPRLEEVLRKGQDKNAAFLILLISHFEVTVSSNGGRNLQLNLSSDLPVLQTTKQKQLFQQACAHDKVATEFVATLKEPGQHRYVGPLPFRWASGGYLPIFVIDGIRYSMLFLRDLEPVVGWNVANGASASPVELWHVEMMVEREPKEEILVINRAGPVEFCYRLESPGGSIQTIDHHKKVLKKLGRNIPIEMKPLIGRIAPHAPDQIEVTTAPWAKKHVPHVTPNGFVIFNPENGENGIEFIQVVEWNIPETIFNLAFLDAELHERSDVTEGKLREMPIQQAVGLFAFDELIHEFQRDEPRPRPRFVFDKGNLLSGEVLDIWLKQRPHSSQWCPVAQKVLRRYIGNAFGICNSMVRLNQDTWAIAFEGKAITVKHRVGLIYLAHLLGHRGQSIPSAKLSSLAHPGGADSPPEKDSETGWAKAQDLLVKEPSLAKPLLDHLGLRQIRQRQKELQNRVKEHEERMLDEESNPDSKAKEQLQTELNTSAQELAELSRYLRQALRNHTPDDPLEERLRSAVTKAVRHSLRLISQHHPSLGRHLTGSIHTGRECIYSPQHQTTWSC